MYAPHGPVVRVALLLALLLGAAVPVTAQVTTCSIQGSYALTASLFYPDGPYQLGGTVVFTPPATCTVNAVGTAVIDVVYTARAGGPYLSYRDTVPYRFDGTLLYLNEGLAVGALSGIADGVANSIVLVAGSNERTVGHALAGTMVRQAAVGVQGPPGPAGPAGLGYVLQAGSSANLNPADSTTYYYGCFPSIAAANTAAAATNTRCYVPRAGTITAVVLQFWNSGTLASAQTSSVSVRLNLAGTTAISAAVLNNAASTVVTNTGLSIPVVVGDHFQILWTTPAWATNPTAVRLAVAVYIE